MAQAEYEHELESMGFSFGAGLIATRADPDDPDGDELTVKWVLRREADVHVTGGDAQPA